MQILPFKEFKLRLEKLKPIPNHLSTAHTVKVFNQEYNKFTEGDVYPLHPRFTEFPFPHFGTSLFRVSNQFEGFDEKNISFFQHPCASITTLNRCNIAKFPVFYCSDIPEVSLLECVSKRLPIADAVYYISEWKVQKEKRWITLIFLFSNLPENNPQKSNIEKVRPSTLNMFKDKLTDNEVQEYLYYYDNQFTSDNSHVFSSLIAHSFLYGSDDCNENGDMILYPSVQTKRLGNNYAFNTRFINDGTIKLSKAYKIRIDYMSEKGDNTFTYYGNLISVGIPLDETFIQWQNPSEEDYKTYKEKLIRLI